MRYTNRIVLCSLIESVSFAAFALPYSRNMRKSRQRHQARWSPSEAVPNHSLIPDSALGSRGAIAIIQHNVRDVITGVPVLTSKHFKRDSRRTATQLQFAGRGAQ